MSTVAAANGKEVDHAALADDAAELIAVGVADEQVYRSAMPLWRFELRQIVMRRLAREMPALEHIQTHWRTPWRDQYFVKTSLAGTHTFFMLFLPLWYWFGHPQVGKGCVPPSETTTTTRFSCPKQTSCSPASAGWSFSSHQVGSARFTRPPV